MVGETHFLFSNIQFLEVIDHLLFEPIAVDLRLRLGRELGKALLEAFFDFGYASFLERLHLCEEIRYTVQFLVEHSL